MAGPGGQRKGPVDRHVRRATDDDRVLSRYVILIASISLCAAGLVVAVALAVRLSGVSGSIAGIILAAGSALTTASALIGSYRLTAARRRPEAPASTPPERTGSEEADG